MKNLLQKIAQKAGYTILKNKTYHEILQRAKKTAPESEKNNLLNKFYSTLKEINFQPDFIVDIGANTGTWTREALKYFPQSSYLLIEPQERLSAQFSDLLQNPKIKYLPVGVGDKNDVLKFTIVDRDDSCSFIYSEEEAAKMGYKQIEVPIKTLDSIIHENNLNYPDIVKIDAEGLDLEVIDGSSTLFGKTEIFIVEAGIQNKVYKNSLLRLVTKMDDAGYELYDITDLNRPLKIPVLWLVELVFVRKGGKISQFPLNLQL
ncbi:MULTISPECIES: FkbM family methyltransferase [Chryseobacterium]|uniref:FkbM family methyltransferase n=1 Tax=Chryseobacterium TaxID=59732 RepID=UPI00082B3C92|nr:MULTISPECIES: FkbM family methyltransferase [Chryseobacterium]AZA59062.1 FkbM family methyltransferase [Chryseobacterium shandongense]